MPTPKSSNKKEQKFSLLLTPYNLYSECSVTPYIMTSLGTWGRGTWRGNSTAYFPAIVLMYHAMIKYILFISHKVCGENI